MAAPALAHLHLRVRERRANGERAVGDDDIAGGESAGDVRAAVDRGAHVYVAPDELRAALAIGLRQKHGRLPVEELDRLARYRRGLSRGPSVDANRDEH